MLGDIDVDEFERTWTQMLKKFGLENNSWLRELYDKRNMWSSTHICENSFCRYKDNILM